MIKIEHELKYTLMKFFVAIAILTCSYLLRRKSNFDEIHNTSSNLSNCFAMECNIMILSCYIMLNFVFDNNRDKFYRNCFKTFLKINNSRLRLCILCIDDLFFFLSGRINKFSLCVCNEWHDIFCLLLSFGFCYCIKIKIHYQQFY